MVLMDESPELFDGFYGNILEKIRDKLSVEENLDIISYNIKTLLNITQCLAEPAEISKWKGVTDIIVNKCK